jgi:hypothetical protein
MQGAVPKAVGSLAEASERGFIEGDDHSLLRRAAFEGKVEEVVAEGTEGMAGQGPTPEGQTEQGRGGPAPEG